MASTSNGSDLAGKVQEFCSITGANAELANSLLLACNGSLELAINMHMEGVQVDPGSSSSSSQVAGPSRMEAPVIVDDEDGVRAPIPQRQEQLVGAGYEGYSIQQTNPHKSRIKTVFDGFRNFKSESGSSGSDHGAADSLSNKGKKRTLEELFKPPMDLIFKGDWLAAREKAEQSHKWLIINIQDAGEFQCQILNRDIWSNSAVKSIVNEHFLFWQQYKESEGAQRYMTFYPVLEWPHVAVIDPRTGEHLVTWNQIPDSATFCELATEFLALHPSFDANPAEPVSKKPKTDISILDADEDDQIALAIRASLAETSAKKVSNNADSDSDEFSAGNDSNFSTPSVTPVKARSKVNSRVPSPGKETENVSNGKGSEKVSNGSECANDLPDEEDWKLYLGEESEEKSNIMIRFPDGKRENKTFPCSTKFKAIALYVKSHGFHLDTYEIVTNFPRRVLTDLDETKSLKDLNLFPQESVFVQSKS